MLTHIKVIAILHIVMGAFGILAGIAFLMIFGGIAGIVGVNAQSSDSLVAMPILGMIGAVICAVLVALSLPGIICGFGLLQFKPWARILAIILSVIHILNIPFGTALGVYSIWALLSPEGEALFRRPSVVVARQAY